MFRAVPGRLPAAGARDFAGITLPPGRIVTAQEGDGAPVAWISAVVLPEDQLTELVRALAAVFPQTGLWPMQAQGLDDGNLDRPWGEGEMDGPEGQIPDALEMLLALDHFEEPTVPAVTALAPAQPGPDLRPDQLDVEAGGLLLVPAGRPADVPAALGWWGGTNYAMTGADFSAVLRSWEDRFGAILVSIGFDTMTVQVGRRPVSEEQTDALLREHYGFCPDNIDQGMPPDAFRLGLAEWGYWNFWWD